MLSVVTKELPVKVLQTCPNCLNTSLIDMNNNSEPSIKSTSNAGSTVSTAAEQTVPQNVKAVEDFDTLSVYILPESSIKKENDMVVATPKLTASQSSSDDLLEIDLLDASPFSQSHIVNKHLMGQLQPKDEYNISQKSLKIVSNYSTFSSFMPARKDTSNAPMRTRARRKRLRHTPDSSDEDDAMTEPNKGRSHTQQAASSKENSLCSSDCAFLSSSPKNSSKIKVNYMCICKCIVDIFVCARAEIFAQIQLVSKLNQQPLDHYLLSDGFKLESGLVLSISSFNEAENAELHAVYSC